MTHLGPSNHFALAKDRLALLTFMAMVYRICLRTLAVLTKVFITQIVSEISRSIRSYLQLDRGKHY